MKIAYLSQMADIGTENGISKKIRAQTVHWLNAGHEVRYFALAPSSRVWPGMAPLVTEVLARGSPPARLFQSLRLARRIRAWCPDLIYFRYAYHSPGLPGLFRAIPTVAEINSDDLSEYPLTLSRAKQWYHRATRPRLLGRVAAFVTVTRELGDRFAGFGRPVEVIGNAINLSDFALAPCPPPNAPTRLVFVGSAGTPWHGIERVVELATLFPETAIDVIGLDPVAAPSTVVFHGELPRIRYEPLLHGATAAIGTLALYRKRMKEACPLKVREYLALGLPVLAAYRDTDIPDGADYFLQLPNDAAPLASHRDRIGAWLGRWRGRRVPRGEIAHLDTTTKEVQRLEFMRRTTAAFRS